MTDEMRDKAAALGIDLAWALQPVTPSAETIREVNARNEAAYGTEQKRAHLLGSLANLGGFMAAVAAPLAALQDPEHRPPQ